MLTVGCAPTVKIPLGQYALDYADNKAMASVQAERMRIFCTRSTLKRDEVQECIDYKSTTIEAAAAEEKVRETIMKQSTTLETLSPYLKVAAKLIIAGAKVAMVVPGKQPPADPIKNFPVIRQSP